MVIFFVLDSPKTYTAISAEKQPCAALGLETLSIILPSSCRMPYLCAGGNCNTVLVANIYGEAAQIDETVSRFLVAKSG